MPRKIKRMVHLIRHGLVLLALHELLPHLLFFLLDFGGAPFHLGLEVLVDVRLDLAFLVRKEWMQRLIGLDLLRIDQATALLALLECNCFLKLLSLNIHLLLLLLASVVLYVVIFGVADADALHPLVADAVLRVVFH